MSEPAAILTRYRISGALFLLALAAIFGPMLFDGAGLRGPQLPAMPAAKPGQPVVAPGAAFEGLEEIAEQAAALRGSLDADQFDAASSTVASVESGSPTLPPRGSTAAESGAEAALRAGQERPAVPGLAPASASTAVWAVQVASFSNRDNAVALRSQLRDRGFEAFLSQVKLRSKVLTRVAVGPYLSEAEATRAQRLIGKSFDLEVQLVAMVI